MLDWSLIYIKYINTLQTKTSLVSNKVTSAPLNSNWIVENNKKSNWPQLNPYYRRIVANNSVTSDRSSCSYLRQMEYRLKGEGPCDLLAGNQQVTPDISISLPHLLSTVTCVISVTIPSLRDKNNYSDRIYICDPPDTRRWSNVDLTLV